MFCPLFVCFMCFFFLFTLFIFNSDTHMHFLCLIIYCYCICISFFFHLSYYLDFFLLILASLFYGVVYLTSLYSLIFFFSQVFASLAVKCFLCTWWRKAMFFRSAKFYRLCWHFFKYLLNSRYVMKETNQVIKLIETLS